MPERPPEFVALDPDDDHAESVGRTVDGVQYFLTTPFVPARSGEPGREFIALYRFDATGVLLDARIEDCGPRATLDDDRRVALRDEMLASLGEVSRERVRIAPFRLERFGVEFGFIPQPPEEPGDAWRVTVEPGDFMAFFEPWDSGEYDT